MTSAPRVFIYGTASFTRGSIPQTLADFEWLPKVDPTALTDEAKRDYEANLEAYELFVLDHSVSLREIEVRTGVHRKQLYRLLDRVVSKAADGVIYGLRGLIPFKHIKDYARTMKVARSSKIETSSAAGAMQQLLNRFPHVRDWIKQQAKLRSKPLKKGEIREVRKPPKRLHADFLVKCKGLGVTEDEWPFNQDYEGERSFYELLKRYELQAKDGHARAGSDSTQEDVEQPRQWPVALSPFFIVQFDGHKVDIRITISVLDPFGFETLFEITRLWILVLTDVRTRAILGYSIAFGPEYNKDDFAEALQCAIGPHRPVDLTIPGLKVKDGGGFPTALQPELAYHRWNWLQFDEAKSHLATDSLDRVTKVLGTWTCSGRLGEPNDRAMEERLFGILEEAGFHRLPGTLGSSPNDERRKLADVGGDLDRVMRVDELKELVYVLLANRNGEPQDGVGGRTPLEAIRHFTSKPDFLMQSLPASKRHQLYLLREAIIVPIKGRNTTVHVNFEGVRYSSDTLARKHELVGQELRIYFIARDIRKIHAFFMDGSELGILVASKQWRTTPHSLRLRKEILRLKRLRKLTWGANDDPVAAYIAYKRKEAKTSKRSASQLAKAQEGIAIASRAAASDLSPFATTLSQEPAHPVAEADALAQQLARTLPKGKVVPTPLNLSKTILF